MAAVSSRFFIHKRTPIHSFWTQRVCPPMMSAAEGGIAGPDYGSRWYVSDSDARVAYVASGIAF